MNWNKKLVALVVAIIFGLSLILIPVANHVLPVRAAVTWTKYTGELTLDSEQYVVDVWVIEDDGYKMWYTHGESDLTITEIIDDIKALTLTNLVDDVESLDVDGFLDDLSDLSVSTIDGVLDGTATVIGYATSTNGRTWTKQETQALGDSSTGFWNSVGAPSVIKDDTTYKMWYTRLNSDLNQTDRQNILNDLGGDDATRKAAILNLLGSTRTVIGYATWDGVSANWTVMNNEVLAAGGDKLWNSVGAPSVIKDDAEADSQKRYKMWYTRVDTDQLETDLDTILTNIGTFGIDELIDIFNGTSTVIAYATSPDGTTWTVQYDEVLPGDTALWDSVADPSVIKTGSTYEMWYTTSTTNMLNASLQTLRDEITGLGLSPLWTNLTGKSLADFITEDLLTLDVSGIESVLSDTSTVIGYATSTDGINWTVRDSQDIVGSGDTPWSGVAAPSVVKSDTYRMWYTEGITGLTWQNLIDLLFANDLPIGYAYYIPPAGGGGIGVPSDEDLGEMDPDEAADILGEIAEDDPEAAGDILGELGEDDPEAAGDILRDIIEDDPDLAADILEEVIEDDPDVAADILEEMDVEAAATVMEELSTDALTDVIPEMSEESLTDILPGLSPDTLYSVDPDVLFDSLPNAPTEQLVSEDPPEPPADAEAPIIVYTTPSGARYLAVRTWAGEWVIVMGTPPPIDQLMIKTREALIDVETIVEIFEKRPSGVTRLPAGQVASAYFTISFENATAEDIELGHITFYVEKEWLEDDSIHKWSVALNRYDPELEQWIDLPTKRVKEDDYYVYYTTTITHFSTFAIAGSETLPPKNFEVSDLNISPVEAEIGEATITVSADVTNLSDETGTYVATLWIDGTVEAGQDVNVEAGETEPVSFTVTREAAGSYEVRLDRLYGSFSISEVEEVEEV